MIRLGPDVCRDPDQALAREWLETNGLGSYASSTVAGANTRRYHGLLIAAAQPPVGRQVLLSKIDETVSAGGGSVELGCALYPGVVHPEGYRLIEEFRLDPWPVWRWDVGFAQIEKSVCLLDGEDTVAIEYRLVGGQAAEVGLELRPLIAFRDYHGLTHANGAINNAVTQGDGWISIRPYEGMAELFFGCAGAAVSTTGDWYFRYQYPRERERGLDFEEDLFQPFRLNYRLTAEQPVILMASTKSDASPDITRERARRVSAEPDLPGALSRAGAQFIVARGAGKTVIAGYHWFTDWGRDTMISLPHLTQGSEGAEIARGVLTAFAPWMKQGLLPNRFPDGGEQPEYNAADATLWYVEAMRAFAETTGDFEFVREHLYEGCKEIVAWRKRGTLFGIRVDADGLLSGGAPGVQLTWMDAKVGDHVITPRAGKAVEIQALWHNALRAIADFAGRFGDAAFQAECTALADRAQASFAAQFWNTATGCLFDVIDGDARDGSVRPNQLLALSMRHPIWTDGERGRSILDVTRRDLLTPFGLRTLAPNDPKYIGRYGGDQASRDGAYHQGTVWPWLLGPYVRAVLAVEGAEAARDAARGTLDGFREHLLEAGIGQISEIFEGEAPHAPRGCIAQAWSVAELLGLAQG